MPKVSRFNRRKHFFHNYGECHSPNTCDYLDAPIKNAYVAGIVGRWEFDPERIEDEVARFRRAIRTDMSWGVTDRADGEAVLAWLDGLDRAVDADA